MPLQMPLQLPLQLLRQLRGHTRTLYPQLRARLCGVPSSPFQSWQTTIDDADRGALRLTGELRDAPASDTIVLLVHGLGGGPDSTYCRSTALALGQRGLATLSLALRGADLGGEDFYHVGQTADLHGAIASSALARYRRIYLLGFSMGGHVALHLAADVTDPRVIAIAAVCTPLDLLSMQEFIDDPRRRLYRDHVLDGLKAIYTAVAARRAVPTPAAEVQRVRSIYDWDRLTIAPRYGFRSAEHSYAELSVAQRLRSLRSPALLVAAEDDPMVAASLVRSHLPARSNGLDVRFARRAGHVAFPRNLDLGFGPRRGLVDQLLGWFRSQA
jgi:hypothetical protein